MTSVRARLNRWRRRWVQQWLFRPVFGETSQGEFRANTRISPSTFIENPESLTLGDHVYIGPFNWLEASGGLTIDEGVQITSHVSIVTHSSHRAQRLMGSDYATWTPTPTLLGGDAAQQRPGWIAGPVHIGAYTFIGPHSLIEANSRLGKGCIVCAGAQVRGDFTDFSILEGAPARVVGDARRGDAKLLASHPEWRERYEAWAGTLEEDERPTPRRR